MKSKRIITIIIIASSILGVLIYTGYYLVGSVKIARSNPYYSYSTYLKCIKAKKIRDEGPFLITEKAVCITAPYCIKMKDSIKCAQVQKGDDDRIYTWKVVKNINEKDVSYQQLMMNDIGFRTLKTPESNYKRNAGIITVNDSSYFVWYVKGNNGRFFKIDKDTFKYLGNDQYRDKNGLIEKKYKSRKIQ